MDILKNGIQQGLREIHSPPKNMREVRQAAKTMDKAITSAAKNRPPTTLPYHNSGQYQNGYGQIGYAGQNQYPYHRQHAYQQNRHGGGNVYGQGYDQRQGQGQSLNADYYDNHPQGSHGGGRYHGGCHGGKGGGHGGGSHHDYHQQHGQGRYHHHRR